MKLDTATLAAGLSTALQSALATEKGLGASDIAALTALSTSLIPLATAEMAAIASSSDPAVQVQYLALCASIVPSKAGELGLAAEYIQPTIIAGVVKDFAAGVVKAIHDPIVATVIQAAVAAAVAAL